MVIVAVLVSWLLVFTVGTLLLYRADKAERERRLGHDFERFYNDIKDITSDRERVRKVYEYFQKWKLVDDFPVMADDRIVTFYGIDGRDIDELVTHMCDLFDCSKPPDRELEEARTIRDLITVMTKEAGSA